MAKGIDTGSHPNRQVGHELKARVTRTRTKLDNYARQYGANDIPQSHPLYGPMLQAKREHREALSDYVAHQALGDDNAGEED